MWTVNSKYLTLILGSVAIYLMWMDVGFYLELQQLPVRTNTTSAPSYTYTPFQPITIKQLMLPATVQVNYQLRFSSQNIVLVVAQEKICD